MVNSSTYICIKYIISYIDYFAVRTLNSLLIFCKNKGIMIIIVIFIKVCLIFSFIFINFFPYFNTLSQTVHNILKTSVENVPVIRRY
jgi:hypothetical protein